MKKIILSVFLLLVGYNTLYAQDSKKSMGYILSAGGQFSILTDLNTTLENQGFKGVPSAFFYSGLGLDFNYKKHNFRFEGRVFTGSSKDSNMQTTGRGYITQLNYAYRFDFGSGISLMPYMGVSSNLLKLDVVSLNQTSVDFNQQLTQQNAVVIDNEIWGIDIGTRILLPFLYDEYMPALLTLGYTIPLSNKWTVGEQELLNSPDLNIGGFKVGLDFLLKSGK